MHDISEGVKFKSVVPKNDETSSDKVWMIQGQRSRFFTGREDILVGIRQVLTENQEIIALTGLAGIGKTKTAIEYAYVFREHYTRVLWANGESKELCTSSFVLIADALDLPERNVSDQYQVVKAVQKWLENQTPWLLIFDNVQGLDVIKDFVSFDWRQKGHILITTLTSAVSPIGYRIEISPMNSDDGALLLLRRATIIEREATLQTASKNDQHIAREISKELEGHPLALEQAGAHIEESASNLRDYLEAYRTQGVSLLRERGKEFIDYPRSVVATLLLSYAKIEQANFGASEFLKFCAFLHPDNIPIKIFLVGSHILSTHLQNVTKDTFSLDNAIKEIRRYSFLRREDDIIGIHRLIQQVLRANMTREKQLDYLRFSITLLNLTFPSNIKFETWGDCEQLFPHVTNCAGLIRQFNLVHEEAAQLFNRTGYYLLDSCEMSRGQICQRQIKQERPAAWRKGC